MNTRQHLNPSHPGRSSVRLDAVAVVLLTAAVAGGVALTWVLADTTRTGWYWGVLATWGAVYGACRAAAPPSVVLVEESSDTVTRLEEILRRRDRQEITAEQALLLIGAIVGRPAAAGSVRRSS